MATRRRKPLMQPETNSLETMEEELQPTTEEKTENSVEVVPVESVIPTGKEENRERTPLAPKPVRLHPRNIPKFSKSRKGI